MSYLYGCNPYNPSGCYGMGQGALTPETGFTQPPPMDISQTLEQPKAGAPAVPTTVFSAFAETPWEWAKRNKWWLIGGAALLVVAGGVGRKQFRRWF